MWVSFNSSYLEFVEFLGSFIHAFHQILNVSSYYFFFKYSLCLVLWLFLCNSHNEYIDPFHVAQRPLRLCQHLIYIYAFFFLSVPQSQWFPLSCLQVYGLIFFCLVYNQSFNPSSEFFHFNFCIFQLQNFFLVSFYIFFVFISQSVCALFFDLLHNLPFLFWASLKQLP